MELFSKLGIDWRLIIIQIINFLILLFILKRYLYGPLLTILEKRKARIAESLETAEKMKKEFESFEAEKEKNMKKARGEAKEILATAAEHASALEARAAKETEAKSGQLLTQAKKEIAEEKGKIIGEAKGAIAELVTDATAKLLREKTKGKGGERFIARAAASSRPIATKKKKRT